MTVIQFPEKRKTEVTKERMDSLIDELGYLYDNLERAYQIIHKLEEETSLNENVYNELFREYVAQVEDHEQVEIKYLNYSTEANVIEDEKGNLRIAFYDDTTETETPL
jgi:hypothetical protein